MVDIYVGPDNTQWILHEKLLCYHSPIFRQVFYKEQKDSQQKSYGLPDEDDLAFKAFVAWLYSSSLPVPREESNLGLQFDLYLLAEKLQIPTLIQDILQNVREWYKYSDTYPSLRRIQYIYANTEDGSPMRHMLVHAVARQMVLEDGIPKHWEKALKKNGELAVDIIKAVQEWRLEEEIVPDAREEPADAEELVDVDGEDEDEVEEGGEVGDVDDETVVDSPMEKENQFKGPEEKGANGAKDGSRKVERKMSETKMMTEKKINGLQTLSEMPNGISVGDYGTNH
jgi:hypothetical protein